MYSSIFRGCIAPLWVLLFVGQTHATMLPWQDVKTMPFVVRDGMEIARQAWGKKPASLYLVCSQNKELHLVLSTRLPAPRWTIGKGRDSSVSLFVGGVRQQLLVVMDLVEKGKDHTWYESVLSLDGEGDRDTLVTTPIKADEIASVSSWFGDTPPSKVSVIGFSETGVFMVGAVAGPAIAEFHTSCVAE